MQGNRNFISLLILVLTATAVVAFSCRHIWQTSSRLSALEGKVTEVEKSVNAIQFVTALNEKAKTEATLTVDSRGEFATVTTDLGVLTVSLEDIAPFASGTRVLLKIGNPFSANIDQLEAELEWGKNQMGLPNENTARGRKIQIDERFPAGGWATKELILEGISPAEFGFVRLKNVHVARISLKTP